MLIHHINKNSINYRFAEKTFWPVYFSYFFLQNIHVDCGYSLELGKAVLTCTYNLCLDEKYFKKLKFVD